MAKLKDVGSIGIGGSAAGGAVDGLFAMLAYVGIFICMISTLVGIKIWWFKRRLTFDHSRTSNGAAGGATPTVPLRTRSSRDKRMSQEIREPVEVHGVFRRRQDDDLDIVPTKQLPPVRIRNLSQSTPSLFPLPPPRRQQRVRSAIYEEIEPPTRQPPRPPTSSPPAATPKPSSPPCSPINSLTPPHHTPTISLAEEMPTFEELEQKYKRMELEEAKAKELNTESEEEAILRKRELTPPQPPKRLNRSSYNEEKLVVGMRKFVRVKSPSTIFISQSQEKLNERRVTGYLRPEEEHIHSGWVGDTAPQSLVRSQSVEKFGERRPSGYIKYEEIDADGLADFRNKWDTLQSGLSADSPLSFQSSERADYEALHGHTYDHLNRVSKVADGEPTSLVDVNIGVSPVMQQSWQADERLSRKQHTPESQTSMSFTSDEEFADELGGFKAKPIMKSATVANCSFNDCETAENMQTELQPLEAMATKNREVKFADPEHAVEQTTSPWEAEEEKHTLKMPRPTGFAHTLQSEHLWDELEANIKQGERENHIWLEIEKEVELNKDFTRNIEVEFDKIRHSYEENEAAFLENNNSNLNRVPEQVLITTPEPEGFGKNIEEDWESFESLRIDNKSKPSENTTRSVVQFNLADLEDAYESNSPLSIERHPAGFVHNNIKLQRELSIIEDVDEVVPTSPHHTPSRVEFVNEDNELYAIPVRSLKQPRPTGCVHTEITQVEDDYVHEHNKESIFEPAEESLIPKDDTQTDVRPRPRQKVTFDFSNTEYYQAPYGEEEEEQEAVTKFGTTAKHAGNVSDSIEEEDELAELGTSCPTPMQRITKIHYTAEAYNNDRGERGISPTISSTPVPLLFGTQASLKQAESSITDSWATKKQATSISAEVIQSKVINIAEPPKPAYRNPLGQATPVRSVTLREEHVVMETQQPRSTFQPHAAARQQYFEQSYHNSTEA